ncbi:uncharacterized protein LOC127260114 [Andrographis paniculata]|uniref:uncharacterized protein LOC127260114 n=1 Tax=Andrographis paniculata TaxID=175694 RepID=UPI0021E8D961|nr:uncharacterized protein LOC127260114 [Andrographis paniculata]
MGKKKLRKVESESEVEKLDPEFEEDFVDVHKIDDGEFQDDDTDDLNEADLDHDEEGEEADEESEEDEDEVGKEYSEDDDDLHTALNAQKGHEMEELEKEYEELRSKEQDLWRNLKHSKDDDIQKGQAVKNQRALWDKTLEFRFLLQKSFASSNRLPLEPIRSSFCDSDSDVGQGYSELIASSKKTLDSILELQQALIANNPSIIGEDDSTAKSKQLEASENSDMDLDEEWLQISEMQSRMASFRNKSIDKWHRKTQVTTGRAAIKDKLHAFNQSISEQVSAYMRDPSKMIKGMQQNKSAVAVFGNVSDSTQNLKQEGALVNVDPELLDDSEFYQQLLKEFFETIDPSSSELAFYATKRLQTKKKRKLVDCGASKSRKIRYHVHEKIVNFMAPQPMKLPPAAPQLFENLFGLKTQKHAFASRA